MHSRRLDLVSAFVRPAKSTSFNYIPDPNPTPIKDGPRVEMSRLTRDGTAEPVSRDQFSGANGDREIFIFPVQLTTSRIGNHTRLIHTLLYVMTIQTDIHTDRHTYKHAVVVLQVFCFACFTRALGAFFTFTPYTCTAHPPPVPIRTAALPLARRSCIAHPHS